MRWKLHVLGVRPWGETNGNYEKDMDYSAVIDELVTTYNADRKKVRRRIPMGGSFAWDLACVKSNEIVHAPVAASTYQYTFENRNKTVFQPALPYWVRTTFTHRITELNLYRRSVNKILWAVLMNNAQGPFKLLAANVTKYTWYATCEGTNHGYQHFKREGGGHDVPAFGGRCNLGVCI